MGVGVGVVMSVSQSVVDEEAEVVSGGRVTETEGEDTVAGVEEEPDGVETPGVEVTTEGVL